MIKLFYKYSFRILIDLGFNFDINSVNLALAHETLKRCYKFKLTEFSFHTVSIVIKQLYLNVKTANWFLVVAITELQKLVSILALPTITSKVIARTLIQKVIFRLWCLQSFLCNNINCNTATYVHQKNRLVKQKNCTLTRLATKLADKTGSDCYTVVLKAFRTKK